MKRSWIRKNQKGVSPVIATILMVAITVVLAAVLYLMVSNFGGDDTTVQTGSISMSKVDDSTVEVRFGKFSPSPAPIDVTLRISNGTGTGQTVSTYTYTTATTTWTTTADNAGTGASLFFNDLGGNNKISIGDHVFFTTASGNTYEVKVLIGSNEVATSTILI